MTAIQNGPVIHNHTRLQGVTARAFDTAETEPGPIMLQGHGDRDAFRSGWIVHPPPAGSTACEPG